MELVAHVVNGHPGVPLLWCVGPVPGDAVADNGGNGGVEAFSKGAGGPYPSHGNTEDRADGAPRATGFQPVLTTTGHACIA